MKRRPPGELKTVFTEPQGGYDPERASRPSNRKISEIPRVNSRNSKAPAAPPQDATSQFQQPRSSGAEAATISQALVDELRTILKEDYGKDLENREVIQIAYSLVRYFDILTRLTRRHHYPTDQG